MNDTSTRCGLAAVIGLPNAGKSTLMNALVGQKISIVSKRVQTTRNRVLGIITEEDTQIVLLDTPGIFDAKQTLERAMVGAAYDALSEGDAIIHLVDAGVQNALENNKALIKRLPKNRPVILVLNKIDKTDKVRLIELAAAFNEEFDYAATYMVSALKEQGTEDMIEALSNHMPQGSWMFDEDQVTDMPMRILAAEITREKIFNRLYRELPTSTFVETENWEEFDNGSVKIQQIVYVQRESQKAIVLGKGGRQIKQIGQESRLELEELFERQVHLKLFVKVKENWTEMPETLRLMGLLE